MASVRLPPSVPLPVTVSTIFYREGESVAKHAPLAKYRYWDLEDDPTAPEHEPRRVRVERVGSLESPVDGHVAAVHVRVNDQIENRNVPLFRIEQKCAHAVQYGGLCALCGEAVGDEKDYSGYTAADGATVQMAHGHSGLKVSESEAAQIERSASQRLAAAGKLILVVDLDQTVIHATVDPTVGEWQRDENCTNHAYVSDVRSFALEEDPVVPPGYTGPKPAPHKCWYYVKTRPGLAEFLCRISNLYELHIYTMATRNYALAIAKIIDPDGTYFGDRILSRDESGSLTHKNLKRLFPVDQSMVAIIDDRGDVWSWEANLIKVVPYDFFVGIGDINSSFLPKKNGQLIGPSRRARPAESVNANTDSVDSADVDMSLGENGQSSPQSHEILSSDPDPSTESQSEAQTEPVLENDPEKETVELASPVARMLEMGGGDNSASLLLSQQMTRSQVVEQQQHDRPLAKLQHDLEVSAEKKHETGSNSNSASSDKSAPHAEASDASTPGSEHLLHDDDTELYTLQSALERVHEQYFHEYKQHQQTRGSAPPDLAHILPRLKRDCLSGIVVLFSGILPMGLNIENADIVIWARQFGVSVVNEVSPEVTHVICRDPLAAPGSASGDGPNSSVGLTLKVRIAKKVVPGVKIVTPDWLFACLSSWEKVPEDGFSIELPDRDWFVPQSEVDKYQRALDARREWVRSREQEKRASILEGYDFNDASAEVDDFLAGLSDDDMDDDDDNADDDENEHEESNISGNFGRNRPPENGKENGRHHGREEMDDGEDKDEEEEDAQRQAQPRGSAFLRGLMSSRQKRKSYESDESEESKDSEEERPQKKRHVAGVVEKKAAAEDSGEIDDIDTGDLGNEMDDLEKELLDELDNMDE